MLVGKFEINNIYIGNSVNLIKDIPGNSIDLVLTDPPFKISQSYSKNVDADNLLAVSSIWIMSQQWLRVLKDGCYLAMYYDTRILPLAIHAMGEAGFTYLRNLTFYRKWGNANKLYGWMSTSDFILLFRKPSDSSIEFYSNDWRHDVYTKDKPESSGMGHKAQKPLDDVRHLIKHLCPEQGIVLDTYSGSGTTCLGAKLENRNFLGFEIDKSIAERSISRLNGDISKYKNPEQLTLI